jgi:hypothetical protein
MAMMPIPRRAAFQASVAAHGFALLLAAPLGQAASVAVTGNGGLEAKASIDVSVVVPKVMQMRLVGHPAVLDVTAEDVARGEITVRGPRIELLVNDRLGYVLRAEIMNALFTAVRISGLPSPVTVTRDAAMLRMPSMVGRARPEPLPVEYQLQLAADTVPGRYPWPVALTLQQP